MKKFLLSVALLLTLTLLGNAQITSPVIRANFGVDAGLRSDYFNGLVQSGNDDWFRYPGSIGTGQFIIDTTGAAALLAGYNANTALRRLPFSRTMRFPGYAVINNRMLLDAAFIRDYHGNDSTVFASGANKNGDSPAAWSCPTSQGVPDKNDILDLMVHVRRAGPSRTDSLWMFGGLSLDNTTGNRYFDFEMYQTDIYYDRGTRQFSGYGPDAGHTSWDFDAAGNVKKPGDIIFSAEYQSASLSNIEARIWVNRSALAITPVAFDWSGQFDGQDNGATYGYASIKPKAMGAYYTGLQCSNGTWGGPFGIILQNDDLLTDYAAKQYVEFSVNLTKLGLDPVTLLGSNTCGKAFRRILVKTRSSASFTSELKDFVGPFDFFSTPRVQATTSTPYICGGSSIAGISVTNPVATSVYQWKTLNGTIISGTSGPTIYVNQPGTYIVTQQLQDGCPAYAADTVLVYPMPLCTVLAANAIFDFKGTVTNGMLQLNWKVQDKQQAGYFDVEQSSDGLVFHTIGHLRKDEPSNSNTANVFQVPVTAGPVYYRIKLTNADGRTDYSQALRTNITGTGRPGLQVYPNPVRNHLQLQFSSPSGGRVSIEVFTAAGQRVLSKGVCVQSGVNLVTLEDLAGKANGVCIVAVRQGNAVQYQKITVIQ